MTCSCSKCHQLVSMGTCTQSTVVEGKVSTCRPTPVISGIPQGSILGPVLFLLFINDMPTVINGDTKLALYAVDAKLFRVISNINNCYELQEQLTNLEKWSEIWRLQFNADKCKFMAITRKITPIKFKHSLGGRVLEQVQRSRCYNSMKFILGQAHWTTGEKCQQDVILCEKNFRSALTLRR